MQPELIKNHINKKKLKEHLKIFGNMVKVVVDIRKGIVGIGGELHADAEALLLKKSSKQQDLWGANVYTDDKKIEYTALINIRPSLDNRSMEIQDKKIRQKVKKIIKKLVL